MKIMRHVMGAAVVVTLLLAGVRPSEAVPVFARKYGFNCTMCHSSYPRLNDFGVRYRQNGYQLPGREDEERTVLESPAPVAFRTSAGFNSDQFRNVTGATDIRQFQVNGLDVFSAGLFRRNIGYLLVYPPQISGSRGVVAQTGTVEMAHAVFANLASTWLNTRFGRYEPAYVSTAFSSARRLTVSPYEIYEFAFPGGTGFAQTQTGVEVYGYGWQPGLKYYAGVVSGSETNTDNDMPADVYVRGIQLFGRGEGQTAGQRLGVTGYFGRARPGAGLPGATRGHYRRIAADASLNLRRVNLGLLWLWANDTGALWGAPESVSYSGGFAELSYIATNDLVGFARYDRVNAPGDVPAGSLVGDIGRWTVGGRYYFADNLALHLEYSQRTQDSVTAGIGDATERFFTTRLDAAF